MTIEGYRTITVKGNGANEKHAPVYLSTGDDGGRILRFVLTNGGQAVNGSSLTCRLLFDQGAGLYQDMDYVSGQPTATWECAVAMGGVTPGMHKAAFEVTDSDGGIVCTRSFTACVEPGVLQDGEQSEEMQDALSDFEERVQAALTASNQLIGITDTMGAEVTSAGVLVVTDLDGTVSSYNVASQLATPISSATSAASAANDAASAANAAATLANTAYNTASTAVTQLASYVPISAGNILTKSLDGTASAPVTAVDAFAGPLLGAVIQGNSTQSGTPTPSAPVAIKSVDDGTITCAGYNLLHLPYVSKEAGYSTTTNGITYTVNANGSISLSGTASANANIDLVNQSNGYLVRGRTYTLCNMPSGVKARFYDGSDTTTSASQITGTIPASGNYNFGLRIDKNVALQGTVTVYPQLVIGSSAKDYQPYATPTTLTLPTLSEPLRSLPDGTHDTLTINRDGSGTVTRRVGKYVVTGNESINSSAALGSYYRVRLYVLDAKRSTTTSSGVCTHAAWVRSSSEQSNHVFTSDPYVYLICQASSSASVMSVFTGAEILYELTTPTTETVPASAMPSIPSQFLTAWLDAEDENDAAIVADYRVTYERSLEAVLSDVLDRFGTAEGAFAQAGIVVDLDGR